ncbi:MAG: hypothetical protein EBU59_05100 [Planctomycetia bacterium]|nr:hypothetical protein [Planctomycetia bacterium]
MVGVMVWAVAGGGDAGWINCSKDVYGRSISMNAIGGCAGQSSITDWASLAEPFQRSKGSGQAVLLLRLAHSPCGQPDPCGISPRLSSAGSFGPDREAAFVPH